MRILVLTWPTNAAERLMTNARRDLLCPAADGIVAALLDDQHELVAVNAAADWLEADQAWLELPCWNSGVRLVRWSAVRNRRFDLVWHCVKVPPPAAAVEAVQQITREVVPPTRVLNPIDRMVGCGKYGYLPLLEEFHLGAQVLVGYPPMEDAAGRVDPGKCFPSCNGALVSLDKRAIRAPTHEGRLGLSDPRGGVTMRYYDTEDLREPGLRTFFRVPFAVGKALPGCLYYCPSSILAPKSGNALRWEPFELIEPVSQKVTAAMHRLGVDLAHLEGTDTRDGGVHLFDINPFPTSTGRTLSSMARAMARRITQTLAL